MEDEKTDWEQMAMGDISSLKKIYERNISDLLYYGSGFCHNAELLQDCVHNLFLYIWTKRKSIGVPRSEKGYLIVSLKRDIVRELNKSKDLIPLDESLPFRPENLTGSVETEIIMNEEEMKRNIQVEEALNQLSQRQKEAIHLRFFQELEYEQICEILNMNYQSARNLIARSIKELRTILSKDI
jgi:RNA polymerase sigma factor (sigma-70 family)